MKRMWLAATVALLCVAPMRTMAQTPATRLPDGVLGVIEIANQNHLQMGLQAYVASIYPQAAMSIPAPAVMLARQTRLANPMTLNAAAPFRVLFVKGEAGAAHRILCYQVTDPAMLATSLMPTLTETAREGSIVLYDEQGRGGRKTVAIGTEGKVVCVGDDKAGVAAALALIKAAKVGEAPLLGTEGLVAGRFQMKSLMEHLSSTGQSPFNALRSQLMTVMAAAQAGNPQAQQQTMRSLQAQLDAVEKLSMQVDSVHFSATADAASLRFSVNLSVLPATGLATYFASVPRGIPATLSMVPENAFFVMGLRLGDLGPALPWFSQYQRSVLGDQNTPPEELEKMMAAFDAVMKAYGDEITVALAKDASVGFMEIIRLKDPAAAENMTANMPRFAERMLQSYKNAGMKLDMKVNPDFAVIAGRKVAEWQFTVDPTPPAGATPMQQQQAEMMRKMMEGMFGSPMKMHSAVKDKDWVITMGADSLRLLTALLEGRIAPITASAVFQQNALKPAAESEGVIYLRLTDLMPWALGFARSFAPMMPPFLADAKFQAGPGVTAFVNVDGPAATVQGTIPAAEIKSLVDGFQQAMQQQMQQPAGGGAPPTPGVKPRPR